MSSQQKTAGWHFWIDRGGTFTDVVALSPDGRLVTHKLLSENPERYRDAALKGISDVLEKSAATAPIIDTVKMGTTVATNALLERHGERVALFVTRGFGDALRIGYQNRPKLFTRRIVLPELLYERVFEVSERITARGEVLAELDETALERDMQTAFDSGIRAVAIVFLHGYRFHKHERTATTIARRIGFEQISASHEVSPLMKLVGRGDTTVVDAYLSPLLRRYVDSVRAELDRRHSGSKLMFMQSNGGLTDAALFRGRDSILSGPAGGVVGMARTGASAGHSRLIGFDMGGTSTDVSLYDGEFERAFETEVAGVRMRAPMMRIHTVAAGGGSVLRFHAGRLQVGPESAGANPGPACYRRDGPLTVTDANVLLKRILPNYFPAVFGPTGDQPLDDGIAREKFAVLAEEISNTTTLPHSPEQVAEGFLRIAVENMANAIKRISIQRGYDISEFLLCCFGAAAGQHACKVADVLGMDRILIHPLAGVLSAYGIGLADVRAMRQTSIEAPLTDVATTALEKRFEALEQDNRSALLSQGIEQDKILAHRHVRLRESGSDTAVKVEFSSAEQMRSEFAATHRRRYGFMMTGRQLTIDSIVAEATGETISHDEPELPLREETSVRPESVERVWAEGGWRETPVYRRARFQPGSSCEGPAIIVEANATTVVEPGWRASVTARNHLLLDRMSPRRRGEAVGAKADPTMLEVFNNLFMHIAEQMGVVLRNTAYSVNIKERLDFSCAVFDAQGRLVANAPHMPVHLGSMGESVQTILRENADSLASGKVYMLNAPYNGGTHLPDVTVVTPVFDSKSAKQLFFVASRAHHADIGGMTPSSMPPASRHIDEEGVLFDNFLLVQDGALREAALAKHLRSGRYPARNPEQNIADLKAQIAANEKGVNELRRIVDHFGLSTVRAYMRHVQDNAEEQVRRVLDVLEDGEFSYELDNGQHIAVRITVDRGARSATVDFTDTSTQSDNNFNAPSAVCKAAVLYVFRTLVDEDIPLNAGCLEPIDIVIPEGSMLSPVWPAAVVAGNVETSQCVTDALYGALGVQAAAQGTMNNLTFGNERYQYYETIAGGSGAGPGYDGTASVQTHMTNSRLTDPEVLEWRFPVLVQAFSIRRGSGGRGRYTGGDGAVRRIEFLEPMSVSILSNHRRVAPFGMASGGPGATGKNWIQRADGTVEHLSSTETADVGPGDVVVIETPGGGGWGQA